ncbi:MAG: IS481 family transposase [Candidatus Thermoplasmatota archaeon]|nr:IS481 family transposase [Candidatus Thermoplasmatota archaeon]
MLSTDDKRFIVKSVENGYKISDLARMFNVTPRRVQQILKEDTSDQSMRRKTVNLSREEMENIENLWTNYKIGSRTIYYLMKNQGKQVSYYQIYNFMRNRNMIKSKDSRIRGETEQQIESPLSTVYMDYHQTSTESPYAVVCVDMSTKKILSIVESRKITKEVMEQVADNVFKFSTEKGLSVKKLYLRNGILSILYGATDLKYHMKRKGFDEVEQDKHGNRVHLALSRLWQNYDRFRWNTDSPEKFMYWYNQRPIINRKENRVTTPNELMDEMINTTNTVISHGSGIFS